ncbi:hypothetical protein VCHA27O13_80023 [Vibrio chagasii]|nr:hypothetical protein VCHA27O13_80023 [Vibrio chagasii]
MTKTTMKARKDGKQARKSKQRKNKNTKFLKASISFKFELQVPVDMKKRSIPVQESKLSIIGISFVLALLGTIADIITVIGSLI